MHPGIYALSSRDKPAVVMAGSGATTTYGELDDRANQIAQLFWERGLRLQASWSSGARQRRAVLTVKGAVKFVY